MWLGLPSLSLLSCFIGDWLSPSSHPGRRLQSKHVPARQGRPVFILLALLYMLLLKGGKSFSLVLVLSLGPRTPTPGAMHKRGELITEGEVGWLWRGRVDRVGHRSMSLSLERRGKIVPGSYPTTARLEILLLLMSLERRTRLLRYMSRGTICLSRWWRPARHISLQLNSQELENLRCALLAPCVVEVFRELAGITEWPGSQNPD